jgi:hypothetical protein
MIRKGDTGYITLWLSLFNLYRYLNCTHKKKDVFSTITSPPEYNIQDSTYEFIELFWSKLSSFVRIPSTDFVISIPGVISSVSVGVSKAMGLKGSSLFACITAVHSYRSMVHILTMGQKASGYSKFEYGKMAKFIASAEVIFKAWYPMAYNLIDFKGTAEESKSTALITAKYPSFYKANV